MKKFLVFLSAMVMVFGMTFTVSAQPPVPEVNMSWHPDGGVNFDMTSRSHYWKYVLADYYPEYVHGWKSHLALVGVHISDDYNGAPYVPGNFKININDEFEAVLEIRPDPGPSL